MKAEDTVIKLNCGGILSDIEVKYYNLGAEAQAKFTWDQATREALIGVSTEKKRLDGTTYLVPDYSKFREALKEWRVK